MAFCELPDLATVQSADMLWRCPVRIQRGDNPPGMADPSFVRCPLQPGQCPIIQTIADQHRVSYKEIVKFGSNLPTTAQVIEDTTFLVHATRWKK